MAEMLSPGVYITEIDASQIVPTVSNSVAVFSGNFHQGPVNKYQIITSVDELITFYGKPSNVNYNDWYQAYNYLSYSNKLLISRAANTQGTHTAISGVVTIEEILADTTDTFKVDETTEIKASDLISLGDDALNFYFVKSVSTDLGETTIVLDRNIETAFAIGTAVNSYKAHMNGVAEALKETSVAVITPDMYYGKYLVIENSDDYEIKETSLAFVSADSKIKIIAKNPGKWSEKLEIAIAKPSDFGSGKKVFDGISLDDLYEYRPTGTEVGIVIRYEDEIKEIFTVDFNVDAKDINNKSTYIEKVINGSSSYIYIKDNIDVTEDIKSYIFDEEGTIELVNGRDSDIQADDLLTAYEVWENKEEIEIDIIIANELDSGVSAKNLAESRKDCIAFIGASYGDTVGKKSSDAVAKLIEWRTTGSLNFNSMFVAAFANYKYQYDRYNDKNRWINIAGDCAGLRSATNTDRASWWASAGLERGQIRNVIKLAFNPVQAMRDFLYKNGLNPIVSFPGQGTVVWGQKVLLDKASSFDRINVRGLFNTLERSLAKMAKYQVMEFNDNFTRNRIISMIKPFLSSVQAGRGIADFLVICDESNNTPDVISRNQLVVDVFIKPNYVAEFIHLKFTNAGTNSFSSVIGGA